jgi:hypothetical protein
MGGLPIEDATKESFKSCDVMLVELQTEFEYAAQAKYVMQVLRSASTMNTIFDNESAEDDWDSSMRCRNVIAPLMNAPLILCSFPFILQNMPRTFGLLSITRTV